MSAVREQYPMFRGAVATQPPIGQIGQFDVTNQQYRPIGQFVVTSTNVL